MRKSHSLDQTSTKKEVISKAIQKIIKIMEATEPPLSLENSNSEITGILEEIREIKQTLSKQAEGLQMLEKYCSQETLSDLQDNASSLKLSINSVIEELGSLKHLVEESIEESLGQHDQLIQSVLIEVSDKFLSSIGGTLSGKLDMSNNKIQGLLTQENPEESDAASVGYVQRLFQPCNTRIGEIYEKVSLHDTNISSLQFHMMSVAGGKFRGHIDMNGYRILGVGDPKNGEDAVSKDYLERYVSSQLSSEKTEEKLPKKMNTGKLLYSQGLSPKLESPLPLGLLTSGILGFTWKSTSKSSDGSFPFTALRHKETESDTECFRITSTTLSGNQSGTYKWSLSLKALVPAIFNLKNPEVLLSVMYYYEDWIPIDNILNMSQPITLPLALIGQTMLGGHKYDILELAPHQTNETLLISPNCSGFSLQLKNTQQFENTPIDFYVVHAAHSCYWLGF
ncbi:hypothetical protein C10C_0166 [Chlamydia serpentis]|uniref:Uncharacterized protein n=1 Tax=Chlamydia serpentis TaxID=1967782 RepID=A0A2R8FAR3_9CHLA|nr:hypothetical protein [Chlamydia serpentis]SPN73347.1 hypothetical protein C10C_0166 [Chlamydia serpentis]